MFSADAGWSHLLSLVYYSLVRRHPHKLATTIAAQKQLTRIEASASLLKPCTPANRGPKEKNNKISTNTRLQRSYLIFTTDYKPSTLHLYNGRLAWVNLNHQKIIFCFGLILSANPFERFSSGLWLQCVWTLGTETLREWNDRPDWRWSSGRIQFLHRMKQTPFWVYTASRSPFTTNTSWAPTWLTEVHSFKLKRPHSIM